jgi:hypothetical protein
MQYTLLIIWSNLKPDLFHSDNRESLEDMVKDFSRTYAKDNNRYYIFKNTTCIARRVVDCENGEIKYL